MSEQNIQLDTAFSRLLAREGITVEYRDQEGGSFNIESRVLSLPIPNAKHPAIFVEGLIYHEVAHALFTKMENVGPLVDKYGKGKVNIIEDLVIERDIKKRYPGARRTLPKSWDYFLGEYFGQDGLKDANFYTRLNAYFKATPSFPVPFDGDEIRIVHGIQKLLNKNASTREVIEYIESQKKQQKEEKKEEKKEQENKQEQPTDDENEESQEQADQIESDESDESPENEDSQEQSGEEESDEDGSESQEGEEESEESGEDDSESEDSTESDEGENEDDEEESSESSEPSEDSEDETADSADAAGAGEGGDESEEEEKEIDDFDMTDINEKEDEVLGNRLGAYKDDTIRKLVQDYFTISYSDILKNYGFDNGIERDKSLPKHQKRVKKINQMADVMSGEFDQKKSAYNYAASTEHDTGELDFDLISEYKTRDEIFENELKEPNQKNHAFVSMIDMSGSMNFGREGNKRIDCALTQVLVSARFCRDNDIPYRCYGFTSMDTGLLDEREYGELQDLRQNAKNEFLPIGHGVSVPYFYEFFHENMTNGEFEDMFNRIVYALNHQLAGLPLLGGTPLNVAAIAVPFLIEDMEKADNICVTILSDGQNGFNSTLVVDGCGKRCDRFMFDNDPSKIFENNTLGHFEAMKSRIENARFTYYILAQSSSITTVERTLNLNNRGYREFKMLPSKHGICNVDLNEIENVDLSSIDLFYIVNNQYYGGNELKNKNFQKTRKLQRMSEKLSQERVETIQSELFASDFMDVMV